jgi:hypothetical protein
VPKLLPGYQETLIEEFGGLNTFSSRLDLALPYSPACQDVIFGFGGVGSRKGFSLLQTHGQAVSLGADVNGLKTYISADGTRNLLSFTSAGVLFKDTGSIRRFASLNNYMKSATLFGREYICISDGKVGTCEPVQYDGSHIDKVTGSGPYSAGSFAAADSASAGSIAAGTRSVKVVFETRQGALWPTSVSITWSAAGSKKLDLTGILVGPSNIARRHIFVSDVFTPAPASTSPPPDWFKVATINNNTDTSLAGIDFSTDSLYQGSSYNDVIGRLIELPPQAGVVAYNNRLFFYGGLHSIPHELGGATNPYNLSFDNLDNDGWAITNSGATVGAVTGGIGQAWIYNPGAVTTDGQWTNNANLTNVFRVNQSISVRVRALAGVTPTGGGLEIGIANHSSLQIPYTSFNDTSTWQTYEGVLESGSAAITSSDALYIKALSGSESQQFIVDSIELFETSFPKAGGLVWGTKVYEPEQIDAQTSPIVFGQDDGQDVRNAFVLRTTLYAVKERSLWAATDDGSQEPAFWPTHRVSDLIGTPSTHGVGMGDGWAAIVSRSGLYHFNGAIPIKLSQEIQPDWDAINWTYGHTIWCVVEEENKRIYVGVPTGSSTKPDTVYVLDYVLGFNEGQRKWAKWTFVGNSATVAERSDLTKKFVIGKAITNFAIYFYDKTAVNDGSTAINAYYETAPVGSSHGVTHFGGLLAFADGNGSGLLSYTDLQGTNTALPGFQLSNPATSDLWRMLNLTGERIGFRFGTDAAGDWFALKRLTILAKAHPFFFNRGYNP